MFETAIKSAAELGKPTILLVSGTSAQRNEWVKANLNGGPVEIISFDLMCADDGTRMPGERVISCGPIECIGALRGLNLAGAVMFTHALHDDLLLAIRNSLVTIAQRIDWLPIDLMHYVAQDTKYCASCERPDFNGHDRGCPNDKDYVLVAAEIDKSQVVPNTGSTLPMAVLPKDAAQLTEAELSNPEYMRGYVESCNDTVAEVLAENKRLRAILARAQLYAEGTPDNTQVHSTNPGTGEVTLTADDIKELCAWPPTGLFRHTDGGIYEVLMGAQSSTDQSLVVVYKHRWPFDASIWTRPFREWDRFQPITQQQFDKIAQSMDRQAMQQLITLRRTARKNNCKTDDPTQPVATIRRWCSGDTEWTNWQLVDKEVAAYRSTDPTFQVLYLDAPLPIPSCS
jgi:hypothetical protein